MTPRNPDNDYQDSDENVTNIATLGNICTSPLPPLLSEFPWRPSFRVAAVAAIVHSFARVPENEINYHVSLSLSLLSFAHARKEGK